MLFEVFSLVKKETNKSQPVFLLAALAMSGALGLTRSRT